MSCESSLRCFSRLRSVCLSCAIIKNNVGISIAKREPSAVLNMRRDIVDSCVVHGTRPEDSQTDRENYDNLLDTGKQANYGANQRVSNRNRSTRHMMNDVVSHL